MKTMKMPHLAAAILAIAALLSAFPAQAFVNTGEALTLYGNAAELGTVCINETPSTPSKVHSSTQNQWVCQLAADPDIHLTFNATTNLHLTVYNATTGCRQLSYLDGTWPRGLTFMAGEPLSLCGVPIATYPAMLNAITSSNGTVLGCKASFVAAREKLHISATTENRYIERCKIYAP